MKHVSQHDRLFKKYGLGLGMNDPEVEKKLLDAEDRLIASSWFDLWVMWAWAWPALISSGCWCCCCCFCELTHFEEKVLSGEAHQVSATGTGCLLSDFYCGRRKVGLGLGKGVGMRLPCWQISAPCLSLISSINLCTSCCTALVLKSAKWEIPNPKTQTLNCRSGAVHAALALAPPRSCLSQLRSTMGTMMNWSSSWWAPEVSSLLRPL